MGWLKPGNFLMVSTSPCEWASNFVYIFAFPLTLLNLYLDETVELNTLQDLGKRSIRSWGIIVKDTDSFTFELNCSKIAELQTDADLRDLLQTLITKNEMDCHSWCEKWLENFQWISNGRGVQTLQHYIWPHCSNSSGGSYGCHEVTKLLIYRLVYVYRSLYTLCSSSTQKLRY